MPAVELFCQTLGVKTNKLSKEEIFILEAELFIRLQEELKEVYRSEYKDYFRLMKFNQEMENAMFETNFLKFVINDILLTQEYSLEGIACYSQIPEEVICDLAAGLNTHPSLVVSRRIIDLHRSVRPDLYRNTLKKIAAEYLTL
jgi:hypothetical protein